MFNVYVINRTNLNVQKQAISLLSTNTANPKYTCCQIKVESKYNQIQQILQVTRTTNNRIISLQSITFEASDRSRLR